MQRGLNQESVSVWKKVHPWERLDVALLSCHQLSLFTRWRSRQASQTQDPSNCQSSRRNAQQSNKNYQSGGDEGGEQTKQEHKNTVFFLNQSYIISWNVKTVKNRSFLFVAMTPLRHLWPLLFCACIQWRNWHFGLFLDPLHSIFPLLDHHQIRA